MTQPAPEIRPARLDLADQFLNVITGAPGAQITFLCFDDVEVNGDRRNQKELARVMHGAISGCGQALEYLNGYGAGVFFCVNETDLRGKKAANVIAARALFIDQDDGPIDESRITLPPSVRVKTVQGEHAYWLLQKGESLDDWKAAQQTLIAHFSSDKTIHNRDRVLRVPGFYHCKSTPTMLDQVWYGDTSRRFTIAEVMRAYPRVRLVGAAPASLPARVSGAAPSVEKGGRNVYLTSIGGSLRTRGAEYETIVEALRAENAAFAEPLDDAEVETVARSVSRYEPTIDPAFNEALRAGLPPPVPGAPVAPPSWVGLMLTDKQGMPKSCVSNATIILENHPAWDDVLALNVRAAEIVFTKKPPISEVEGPFPRSLRDEDYTRVGVWLTTAQRLGDVSTRPACLAVAARRQFDPVVDYLDAAVWDGVERLPGMLARYCGAHDAPAGYLAVAGTKWAIQCVARAMWPGCQGDATLILEGGQGTGKTSFFRIMAGQWLGEHPPREMGKAMQEFIRGPWIVEFGELSSFKRSEIEEVKSFLTLRVDRYRPAYGHTVGEWPRRCAFGGSTNGDAYLVDLENRRYWPVKCGTFDLVALAADRDQLWAEAVARYDAGEQWHLTPDEIPWFQHEQAARVFDDAITEGVWRALRDGVRKEGMFGPAAWAVEPGAGTVSLIDLTKAFESKDHAPALQARITTSLRKLGWKRERITGRWVRGAV